MIRFVRYEPSDYGLAKKLIVADSQLPYVGQPSEILDIASPTNHLFLIKQDSVIVGFFIIDITYANDYDFALVNELGLRGFLIDHAQQGKGFGVQSVRLLRTLIIESYPESLSMVLTVNCKNKSAYHCYLKGGFIDMGELYHGGSAGPQHILRMEIK